MSVSVLSGLEQDGLPTNSMLLQCERRDMAQDASSEKDAHGASCTVQRTE